MAAPLKHTFLEIFGKKVFFTAPRWKAQRKHALILRRCFCSSNEIGMYHYYWAIILNYSIMCLAPLSELFLSFYGIYPFASSVTLQISM